MAEAAKREGVAIIVTGLSQYAVALALSELPPARGKGSELIDTVKRRLLIQ